MKSGMSEIVEPKQLVQPRVLVMVTMDPIDVDCHNQLMRHLPAYSMSGGPCRAHAFDLTADYQEQSIIPVHSSCYSPFLNYLSISLFVSFFDLKNSRSFRSTLLDLLPLSSPEFRNSRSFRSTLLATPSFFPLWVSRTVDHSGPLFLLPPPSS